MDCLTYAADHYEVPVEIVRSIIQVESNGRNVIAKNRDGSLDIGVMQINTFWLDKLKRHDIKKEDLQNKCTNIAVGTWILRYNFSVTQNWFDSIAAYNAGLGRYKKQFAIKYAEKVMARL